MQPQAADIPAWLGILMFIAGIAITIAMAKYMAGREKRRNEMQGESKG